MRGMDESSEHFRNSFLFLFYKDAFLDKTTRITLKNSVHTDVLQQKRSSYEYFQ